MTTTFINGRIYTEFFPTIRSCEALSIEEGKIIFSGRNETAKKIGGEIIDLKGATVLPGFIDAHLHVDETGMALNNLDLREVKSIEELRKRVREFSDGSREMILGWGWDQELFEDRRWPNKRDVDDLVDDRPLLLSRVDGHSYLVNSFLLELTDLKSDNGLIQEGEADLARAKINTLISQKAKTKYAIDAMNYFLKNGVTSIGFVSCDQDYFEVLKELDMEGKLPMRVNIYVNGPVFDSVKEFTNSERLKLKGIKLFTDGSLGSYTALISTKYEDFNSFGEQTSQLHTLKTFSKNCTDTGRHVAIHAIGDVAMDLAILSLAGLGSGNRIEHCAVVRDDQLDKLAGLSMVVQPRFISSDVWIIDRLGEERSRWIYRFSDFISKGLNVAFSTDSPVESVNPFLGIYSAVTRGEKEDLPLSKLSKNQQLPLSTALHCYTKTSAIALDEEDVGSLTAGKFADFIVLDRDPFKVSIEEITDIKVTEVFVSGNRVVS